MNFDEYYLKKLKKEGKIKKGSWLEYYYYNYFENPSYSTWYREHIKRVVENVSKLCDLSGKKILEIGSGRGALAVELAKKGAEVIGVEIDPDLVDYSKKRARYEKVRASFVQASADSLPFEDNSFDVIISIDVLEHVKKPQDVLNEMCRVLKEEGFAYFSTANTWAFWTGHSSLMNRFRILKRNKMSDFEFLFSYGTLVNMCKRAGFSKVFLKEYELNGFKKMIYLFLKRIKLFNWFVPSFTIIAIK